MKSTGREIKWAACGFIGGFLVCYLLIAIFQAQPTVSPRLAKATIAPATPSSLVAPGVMVGTNMETLGFHIQLPPRWVESLQQPEVPPPSYRLDLIDTDYQPPMPTKGD